MSPTVITATILVAAAGSLVFSTLTYSLRELSRVRLGASLGRKGMLDWLETTMSHQSDLVFLTALFRLLFNTAIVIASLQLSEHVFPGASGKRYALTFAAAAFITLFSSVLIPSALTRHTGDAIVASFIRPLHGLRLALLPVTKLGTIIDTLVQRAVGTNKAGDNRGVEDEVQKEILSAVEEGEKEGVVDEEEREMIESVIEFRDTTAGQIMTARPEIVGIEVGATLADLKKTLEESGLSRLPVYDGTLDHVAGILYARDLLKLLGQPPAAFDLRAALRPAFYVPETKPLRDLLEDFRLQKVHLAIVLDEYGGTAGLVTIEDILEELVGDISDEHEPVEPAMFHRIDEGSADADARIYIDEFNRLMGLGLPEDAGYDTLGGFISTTLGRIPERDASFEHDGARFVVTEAEPHKVGRVRVELIAQVAAADAALAAK